MYARCARVMAIAVAKLSIIIFFYNTVTPAWWDGMEVDSPFGPRRPTSLPAGPVQVAASVRHREENSRRFGEVSKTRERQQPILV